MIKIFSSLCLAVWSGVFSYAQQAISSSHGNGIGAGAKVSFTVVTQLDPARAITLECEAYPNPVTDFLILKVHRDQIENMKYQLIDLNGKVLEEAFIGDAETDISLEHYKPTNCFLKVIDNSIEVMTFKITKLNQP